VMESLLWMWCQVVRPLTQWHTSTPSQAKEMFPASSACLESSRSVAPAWQCTPSHKSENPGTHHQNWLDGAAPCKGKVMVTVFWDCDGVILVGVMPRGTTINSEAYINHLTNSRNVSGEFGLARIQQRCCSSMALHALTQAW
jgi:hypothetical protein